MKGEAVTRTCPAGHLWAGDPADCPACTADGADASTFHSGLRDELPPPPTSVRGASTRRPSPAAPAAGPRPAVEVPGYDVLGELGRGGMGVVYKARHRALNRLVALKVISAGGLAGPRDLERFRAEAAAVARLQHPNVVQVFEVGEHDGRPYLALELVEGGTLAQALAANPIPARPAAELAETLARAVHHAHEQGVVHRDLKPGNILLTGVRSQESGVRTDPHASLTPDPWLLTPKVTDFGLAKRLDPDATQSTTGVAIGTPNYMAPEQAAGLNRLVGPAADVYALGAILYECLTGRPPFQGTSAVETLQQVVTADPVPPARLQPRVPRDLETICLVCLRKEPRKRYPSALALADDLRRFLDGRPIMARRTPMWERAAKWAKRRPALAGLVVVTVLATAALAGAGVGYNRRLERHNRDLADANEQIAKERDEVRREWERAEANLDSATDAVEQMLTRVGWTGLAQMPHMDRTRALLMEDAVRFFDRLLAAQGDDPRVRFKKARTLYLVGTVHYQLRRFAEAAGRYDAGLALVRGLRAEDPPPVPVEDLRRLEGRLLNQRGLLHHMRGEQAAARTEFEAALAVREELVGARPDVPDNLFDLAGSYVNLALVARAEDRPHDVAVLLGWARGRAEEMAKLAPDDWRARFLLSTVLNDLGVYHLELREWDRAGPMLEQSLELRRRLLAEAPGDVVRRAELAQGLSNLGSVCREQGYLRRAAGLYAEALTIREKLAADHPDVARFVIDSAFTLFNMAELSRAKREYEPAEDWYTRAIARVGPVAGDRPRAVLRDAHAHRAEVRAQLGRNAEAVEDLKRAAEFADGPRRALLVLHQAVVLARFAPPAEAAAAAEAALRDVPAFGELLFDAARAFAIVGKRETDRKKADGHLRRAVELLIQAEKLGHFQSAEGAGQLEKNPDLAPLRGRADFKSLQARGR